MPFSSPFPPFESKIIGGFVTFQDQSATFYPLPTSSLWKLHLPDPRGMRSLAAMIELQHNHSLKPHNTFGIEAKAAHFAEITHEDQLRELRDRKDLENLPWFILGGGSNILLTGDHPGLVLHVSIMGKTVMRENERELVLEVGAGENWHELVLHCLDQGWGGIENLSLIPGQVGAAPIQNIGAYGVEIKDVFEYLEFMHLETGQIKRYDAQDCQFGYRDSIFKRELKGKVVILRVAFRLTKKDHQINTSYGAIGKELEARGIEQPSVRDVSNVVIDIRRSKLPDPAEIGNGGSFFKNPEVPVAFHDLMKERFPNMPSYVVNETTRKIPAAWLIDQAGWKGITFDNYGVHKNQALVLVNYGGASGKDIYDLSTKILDSVKMHYGIELEREVNVVP